MILYLDASAVVKLLVEEPGSRELGTYLDAVSEPSDQLVSAGVVEAEVRRFATRIGLDQALVVGVLAGIDLTELDPGLFRTAGLLPGRHLRSLDAIHVASALSLRADELVTYDRRMVEAARAVGLVAESPGVDLDD